MNPKAIVAQSKIQIKGLLKSLQSRFEIKRLIMIRMPPMVGVPDFDKCVFGPSSLIV